MSLSSDIKKTRAMMRREIYDSNRHVSLIAIGVMAERVA